MIKTAGNRRYRRTDRGSMMQRLKIWFALLAGEWVNSRVLVWVIVVAFGFSDEEGSDSFLAARVSGRKRLMRIMMIPPYMA